MTRFKLTFLVFLLSLLSAPVAFAFSTESANDAFKGSNASNFADPDEQQPAFLTGSGETSPQSAQRQPSVNIDQNSSRERYMGLSQGFDHAYNHQQQ